MSAEVRKAPGYIHSPVYDWLLFVLSPLACMALMLALRNTAWTAGRVTILGETYSRPAIVAILLITQGHVASVVVRSHLNKKIFEQHRARLVIVPIVLLAAMNLSNAVFIGLAVFQGFWNNFHFARQHFGIARLLPGRAGPVSAFDRWADLILCLSIQFLPVMVRTPDFFGMLSQDRPLTVAGLTALIPVFHAIIAFMRATHGLTLLTLLAVVLGYFGYHGVSALLGKPRMSGRKAVFMLSLTVLYVGGWLFIDPWLAIWGAILLHSVQYYGLLSVTERASVGSRFNLARPLATAAVTAALVLGIGFGFGWVTLRGVNPALLLNPSDRAGVLLYAFINAVNLLHFWFDGFIWTAQKKPALTPAAATA